MSLDYWVMRMRIMSMGIVHRKEGWAKVWRGKLLTARCAHNWMHEACSRNGGPYYCGTCLNEARTADNRTYGSS